MSNVNSQPIPTLYVNNIESKVKKDELRRQLYALFVPYGKILDVVAQKGNKMRGQAFVVFEEQSAATAAMRALVGEDFYGRPLRITYARSTSNATLQHEDPEAVIAPSKKLRKEDRTIASRAQGDYEDLERERLDEEEGRGKRERAENGDAEEQPDETGDQPDKKKRKVDNAQDGADGDEEEMEMDDE
ncbi:hypothetical protein NCC49_004833 [Naganishia albida]|nr:hypothetical protein NCC49_004833 [Naganishia albida]